MHSTVYSAMAQYTSITFVFFFVKTAETNIRYQHHNVACQFQHLHIKREMDNFRESHSSGMSIANGRGLVEVAYGYVIIWYNAFQQGETRMIK